MIQTIEAYVLIHSLTLEHEITPQENIHTLIQISPSRGDSFVVSLIYVSSIFFELCFPLSFFLKILPNLGLDSKVICTDERGEETKMMNE